MTTSTQSQRTISIASHRSHLSRRRLLGLGGAALTTAVLAGCDAEDEEPDEVPVGEEDEPTVPPTPTQALIASPVPGYLDPERWQGRTLTVASQAIGNYLESLDLAFFEAFAQATGASVRHVELGRAGIEAIPDQVESGEVVWDVVLIPCEDVLPLSQGQYLQGIDYNIVDTSPLYSELTLQHGVGAAIYSTTMVYHTANDEPPETWADFWDLSRAEGTRALRRWPIGTLEFALMADGVEMDKLYPLDVDRAFGSLELLREATQFYEDSLQPVQFVRTGQAGLASAWNVRIDLPEAAANVKPQWNQGMMSADAWAVPRDAPNTDLAMNFINFATRAVPTANFSTMQSYGPVNPQAFEMLREDIQAVLPNSPENIGKQFFEDYSYWSHQRANLVAQFEDWYLNPPVASPEAVATPDDD